VPQFTALFGSAAVLALVAGTAIAHEVPKGRLFFTDEDAPVLRVLDLDEGRVTHELAMPKPSARLVALSGGEYLAVSVGDEAGTVLFVDTGLTFEEHGDHRDVEKGEPKLLGLRLSGVKPGHVVEGHGRAAVFYDGGREPRVDAVVHLVDLVGLAEARAPVGRWDSPGPQHGIAVPLREGRLLVSTPNPAYVAGEKDASSLPIGFRVLDARGVVLAELDRAGDPDRRCLGYHGHAAKGELHLLGCFMNEAGHPLADGGILLVRDAETGIESRKIPYPDGRRVSTLAHGGGRWFVGNYGKPGDYRAFLRIDPEGPAPSPADVLAVPGGQAVCQFAMAGDRLVNLTPYGMLRLRDVEGWKERAARPVVAGFDCAWNAAMRPELALAGDRVYVSDPGRGVIHEFSANDLSPLRRLEVGGRPTRMAGVDTH
jgi:hypothetical protein